MSLLNRIFRSGGQKTASRARPATAPAAQAGATDQANHLVGTVARLRYGPTAEGFVIFELKTARGIQVVKGCWMGTGPGSGSSDFSTPGTSLKTGMRLSCHGAFEQSKYGPQFKADRLEIDVPQDARGIVAYLSDNLSGVGPTTARRIVDAFGAEHVFEVMDNTPDQLLSVQGVSEQKLIKIKSDWSKARGAFLVASFLRGYDIGPETARRIYDVLCLRPSGDKAVADTKAQKTQVNVLDLLKRNPYRIMSIPGIGFTKADQVAIGVGIPREDALRVRAGLLAALEIYTSQGHTQALLADLARDAAKLLGIDQAASEPLLLAGIETLAARNEVVIDSVEGTVTPIDLHDAERGIAMELRRLLQASPKSGDLNLLIDANPERAIKKSPYPLDPVQADAVRMALRNKFSILTGGPGFGKTTIVDCIVKEAQRVGAKVMQLAPTGRAAQQLEKSTGLESSTIHSALYGLTNEHGAADDMDDIEIAAQATADGHLDCDILIVDEKSMSDARLTHWLLRSVSDSTTVLFVGDVDQLPSVGPGNVLGDLIRSGYVPVTRLQKVYRQNAGSGIAKGAVEIIHGRMPNLACEDFRLIEEEDPAAIADILVDEVMSRIRAGVPAEEVQVLSPLRTKGEVCVDALNKRLQAVINPERPGTRQFAYRDAIFREGDRVMQTKNRRKMKIVNGDLGVIRSIQGSGTDQVITVRFSGSAKRKDVELKRDDLAHLTHAYATTVHKSQGGQFKCVLMPLTMSHYIMLNRNLVYTAITRGKEDVLLVGTQKALAQAVRTEMNRSRRTGLVRHIEQVFRSELHRDHHAAASQNTTFQAV